MKQSLSILFFIFSLILFTSCNPKKGASGSSSTVDVVEAEEFGDTEIIKVVKKNLDMEPAKLNASIIKEMEEFKGKNGFMDDITLFTCKIDTTKKG